MVDPVTTNVSLIIPNTGADVGTWGSVAINPDMIAIDGFIGGVATISLSNTNVILTTPGAAIAAGAGPTQAQNAVLQFTGALLSNVTVTLPMPGIQTIANFTTGNFVVTFRAAGSGQVVATPQGSVMRVYNDGTNVKFLQDVSSFPGKMDFLGGVSAVPAWITACTVKPYLLADGTTYNISDYAALSTLYGTSFGGNGFTTFGVPDLQGRVPLAYDGTGTRITTAGCGINGQTLGAGGGAQNITLDTTMIPAHTHAATVTDPGHRHSMTAAAGAGSASGGGVTPPVIDNGLFTTTVTTGISVSNANTGGGLAHGNVQPALVTGIWLIKT